MNSLQFAFACVALATVTEAGAIRVADMPPPTAEAVRNAAPPTTASLTEASNNLTDGMIASINDKGDQIEVHGTWLKLVDGQTQVYRQGKRVTGSALAKGQRIRFSLAAGADRTTLGLVYVP